MGSCQWKQAVAADEKEVAESSTDIAIDRERDKKQAKEENRNFQRTMQFLSQVALLKRLPKDQHPLLAKACVLQNFQAEEVVISQGDVGAEFFVIESGEARVYVAKGREEPVEVALLKAGDYFGENALLRDEPRAATIKAVTTLSTYKITREKFQALGLNEKLQFANRKAVGAGGKKAIVTKAPSPKTDEERTLIAEAMRQNENLQTMVQLSEERIDQMIDVAWKEEVPAGKKVITEGDLVADYFYIVQEGKFDVLVEQDETAMHSVTSAEKVVTSSTTAVCAGTLSRGSSFGELALLYLVPRAATIKALVPSVLWVIDRQNFKNILMKVSDEKIDEYVRYLNRVQVLNSLLAEEKRSVATALVEMHFSRNEVILQQGEPGSTFYILYEGDVSVHKDGELTTVLQASPSRNTAEFFGERALLNNEPRAATVTVTSPSAKALALDRDSFQMMLGPLQDIIDKASAAKGARRLSQVKGKPDSSKNATLESGREKICRNDLRKIGLLGCGGFGVVELWEHKATHETYAMKGLSKGFIVKTGMQESVMNEKNILLMTNSTFIIRLYETFNSAQMLYFLMEPALGGELYATYNRKGLHGREAHAKFYVAGTVCAFEHLHERRIIYRDLKPENLLLTETGSVKLTDMGLAKFVIGKTYTTCGTPDYFAPEIIASTGHTNAVDWWMLGILTFELMSGHPPFESQFPMQIYAKVRAGIGKVPFPAKLQGPPEALIKGLLQANASERLPMRPGGTKNVRDAKWYAGFDWDAFAAGAMEPPYKPTVKSKTDIANFQARNEDMPKQIEYRDDGTGWDKDFAA